MAIVKICGITNVQDALAAVEAGADALGFVFYPRSSRAVTLDQAGEIAAKVPGHVARVGVFVDAGPEEVFAAARACGLTLLQFHGTEPPEFCRQFGLMCMKAFRIRGPESIAALSNYPTDAWLLDAWSPASLGGTGERFDWDLALQARDLGHPIFLAGGLTPENVAEAVRRVRPYGVDVSSGVELSPGKKDHDKVRAFVRAAKAASP